MIELSPALRARIDGAADDQHPLVASSVDRNGQPHLAYYGSAQAIAPDRLAVWVRNPDSGFLHRIERNPRVAFIYWHQPDRVHLHLQGRAAVVADAATRTAVYDNSPEAERALDPERKGVAVVVELDTVRGFADGQLFTQER